MLAQGLKLSGETKDYFIRGRLDDLKKHLPGEFQPRKILDYGCGLGETSHFLSELFPNAHVTGAETSLNAIEHAKSKYKKKSVAFIPAEELPQHGPYDLCYTNGVFHHIEPQNRAAALKQIHQSLNPGGVFALFENNPWNPGTQMVMHHIPFDRDAQMLSFLQAKRILRESGFQSSRTRFLFYFPKALGFLRFLEPLGAHIPLGAQYYILSVKP